MTAGAADGLRWKAERAEILLPRAQGELIRSDGFLKALCKTAVKRQPVLGVKEICRLGVGKLRHGVPGNEDSAELPRLSNRLGNLHVGSPFILVISSLSPQLWQKTGGAAAAAAAGLRLGISGRPRLPSTHSLVLSRPKKGRICPFPCCSEGDVMTEAKVAEPGR